MLAYNSPYTMDTCHHRIFSSILSLVAQGANVYLKTFFSFHFFGYLFFFLLENCFYNVNPMLLSLCMWETVGHKKLWTEHLSSHHYKGSRDQGKK